MRTSRNSPYSGRGDALDQLEYEDRALLEILDEFDDDRLDRLEHGLAGKLLIEHLAVREAARQAVADGLRGARGLEPLARRLEAGTEARRQRLSTLDEMARGIQPVNLNQGQDFDAHVVELEPALREEIRADLEELLPGVHRGLSEVTRRAALPRARAVRRRSPTHPGPRGGRRCERFGPLVRLHALYDWLRGFPTGGPKPSSEVDIPKPGPPGHRR